MDEKTVDAIISAAVEAITSILNASGYLALVRLKSSSLSQRRSIIASLTFVKVATDRRFFTYDFVVITYRHNQVNIKTITKSIQEVPIVKLSLREMYNNPDFSLFLPPYRKVSTIVNISVDAIVADFFTAVEKYCNSYGHSVTTNQSNIRYFEILMKQYTDTVFSKFTSKN